MIMKFAYADPPYLGCGHLYAAHHSEALAWDEPSEHRRLVERLCDEYPDGWALSLHVPSLQIIREMCPADCRTGVWLKSFASFKPNVNPAYCWEPVIWRGGRKYTRKDATVRDFLVEPIAMMKGLPGAKPRKFCRWIFSLLNAQKGDTMDDLFPGTGIVGASWAEWTGSKSPLPHLPLEKIGDARGP